MINGSIFKYCDLSQTLTQLNLYDSCQSNVASSNTLNNKKIYTDILKENQLIINKIFVINKLRHIVHGNAYECKKEKEYVESYEDIWGDKNKEK